MTGGLLILLTLPATSFATGAKEEESKTSFQSGKLAAANLHRLVSLQAEQQRTRFRWSPKVTGRSWKYIVVHHSATSAGSVESIHEEHSRRKDASGNNWLGIGYHFVIGNGSGMKDGEVEATFRWKQQIHGAHSGNAEYNGHGIGICLIGNFEQSKPSESQTAALRTLIKELLTEYKLSSASVIGHNKIKATKCPGRLLPLQQLVKETVGP